MTRHAHSLPLALAVHAVFAGPVQFAFIWLVFAALVATADAMKT